MVEFGRDLSLVNAGSRVSRRSAAVAPWRSWRLQAEARIGARAGLAFSFSGCSRAGGGRVSGREAAAQVCQLRAVGCSGSLSACQCSACNLCMMIWQKRYCRTVYYSRLRLSDSQTGQERLLLAGLSLRSKYLLSLQLNRYSQRQQWRARAKL
eukprot:SAG22_NODE_1705_length_3771_cov_1.831699_2_plen_153_part_00